MVGILNWFKSRSTPQPCKHGIVVFSTEETLPCPLQLTHPSGLWGALRGIPSASKPHPRPELLVELSMETGVYLFQGVKGTVRAEVHPRLRGDPYPGREWSDASADYEGIGEEERERLENALWMIHLELARVPGAVGEAVWYQVELADRLAALSEGIVLDPEARRYYLPGRWRVEGAV